jgi:hypothetical protein
MLLCLAATLLMSAADPAADLQRAQRAVDSLEFEEAVVLAEQAAHAPGATRRQRVEAHLLAGIANRVIGKDVDAKLHFERALQLDPAARVPDDAPPKISAFFKLVREEMEARRAELAPPAPAAPATSAPPGPSTAPPPLAAASATEAPVEGDADDGSGLALWGAAGAGVLVAAAAGAAALLVVTRWPASLGTIDARDPAALGFVDARAAR